MNQLERFWIPLLGSAAVAACAFSGAGTPVTTRLTTTLTGAAEVGHGDPNGTGTAVLTLNPTTQRLCYTLRVSRIAVATAAHVHRGAAGQEGPHLIPLTPPSGGQSSGCATASAGLIADMIAHPTVYYVNVHNAQFPGGAVRGQLH